MKRLLGTGLLAVVGLTGVSEGQDYGSRLGVQRGGEVDFSPRGPGVLFDALDPALRKWYVPQELYNDYRWRQWEYSNYARREYQRYVPTYREGDYFYDFFGNYVTRGWLIYNNVQRQPEQRGSQIFKDANFGNWFSGVVVSSDSKGEYHYAMTIANGLRTTLTPLTFSKPDFDGVQFDVATDKYMATALYSRVSESGGSSTFAEGINRTNNTTLMGGRGTLQVGDFTTLGVNFVNAHQSNTLIDGFQGNPLAGELTVDQKAEPISWIEILLSDDSPGDGEGGAAFFPAGSDITITYLDGTVDRGKEIGFAPTVEGGFPQEGFVSADGEEQITLRYDFESPDFLLTATHDKTQIRKVEFEIVLGNDYKVQYTSNRQEGSAGDPVFLLVAQAPGNVKDNTNLSIITFDYGLPTATSIFGFTVEITDVKGVNVYGEWDNSRVYRRYPYPSNDQGNTDHSSSSGTDQRPSASAWMVHADKRDYPFFAYGEAFEIDPEYATSIWVSQQDGTIDYTSGYYQRGQPGRIERFVYEFIEDNDDQDRIPDWGRNDALATDYAVFPGWDENNDFIPDFNQNDNGRIINLIPDYEEPFLRQNVDRPEYLYGIDANNNTWVDRFENDNEPDLPYKRNRRGWNAYAGMHLTPQVRVAAGRLEEAEITSERTNETAYALLSVDADHSRWGRLRLFEMVKSMRDDLPDNILQWDNRNTLRNDRNVEVPDPLLGRDTFFNSVALDHSISPLSGLRVKNTFKWDLWHQRMSAEERRPLGLGAREFFVGVINKAAYRFELGRVEIEPRWKSEFRNQTYDLFTNRERRELTEIVGTIVEFPMLRHSVISTGIEYVRFSDLDSDVNDFQSFIAAAQLTNVSEYQGYQLTTQAGLKHDLRDFEDPSIRTRSVTEGFITVYAGLGTP